MHRRRTLAFVLGLLACTVGCEPTSSPRNDDLELAKQREAAAREAEQAAQQAAERARADEQARLAALAARQAERERLANEPTDAACPRATWCGSQTIAEQHRDPLAEQPDALGCPGRLAASEPSRELAEGHPPASMPAAELDVAATEAARARGEADRCCYADASPCPN